MSIQNYLLSRYDPIKILSRPALVATLKNNDGNRSSEPVQPSPALRIPQTSSLQQKSSIPIPMDVEQLSSTQKSQPAEQPRPESEIMPPPKSLPYWSQRSKSGTSSKRKKFNLGLQSSQDPGTSSSSKTKSSSETKSRHTRPNPIPKVSLVTPFLPTKTKVVRYESKKPDVSASELRLATLAFSRKVLRKNRRAMKKEEVQQSSHERPEVPHCSTSKSSTAAPPPRRKESSRLEKPPPYSNVKSTSKSTYVKPAVNAKKTNSEIRNKTDIMMATIPENPLVNHTIELLRHKRELQTRLELIEEEGVVLRLEPLPVLKEPIPKGQLMIPNIPHTAHQTKDILQKRLAVLLAHGGFTHVNQQPLEVLADVMEKFYEKMAHRLKQVREMEMAGCEQEFPDPLERVMVEMGLGGVRGVENFYNTRVVDYRKRVEEQCVNLRRQYAHKIRLKVGMVVNSSGGSYSTSSSTSTSSQPIPPGNSVLTEILSGLEDRTASLHLYDQEDKIKVVQVPKGQQLVKQPPARQEAQFAKPKVPPVSNSPQAPSSSSSRPQNPNLSQSSSLSQPPQQPVLSTIQNSSKQMQPPPGKVDSLHQKSALTPNQAFAKLEKSTALSPTVTFPNNMVSINLNNNVGLGGFVPITSPGASRTPTLNVSKGILTGGTDSKAKLKEALSQRNLLRLNFEQVPSTCDSTLLSSSSPLSSSSNSSSSSKTTTPSSSIGQTKRLKL